MKITYVGCGGYLDLARSFHEVLFTTHLFLQFVSSFHGYTSLSPSLNGLSLLSTIS